MSASDITEASQCNITVLSHLESCRRDKKNVIKNDIGFKFEDIISFLTQRVRKQCKGLCCVNDMQMISFVNFSPSRLDTWCYR